MTNVFNFREEQEGGGRGDTITAHDAYKLCTPGLGDSNRPRISGIHVSFWILELPMWPCLMDL